MKRGAHKGEGIHLPEGELEKKEVGKRRI